MTIHTHIQKDGTIWEWEETEELKKLIALQTIKKPTIHYDDQLKEINE